MRKGDGDWNPENLVFSRLQIHAVQGSQKIVELLAVSWGRASVGFCWCRLLVELILPEIHWRWVVLAYLPLWVFIFGNGSGMVSRLANCVRYQLLQG